jgi:glycosyltransferase involved in cell wall biosynthesis
MARLLFLAKRHPQQRDLIARPYGRFFHLPQALAGRGHAVHVALLSHRKLPSEQRQAGGVIWSSDDLLPAGPMRYWRRLTDLAREHQPDWIIGCSDLYYGVLATRLAKQIGARAAIDAYDNFESYLPLAKPLHWLWHRALANADLVTAAGPQLAVKLQQHHRREVQLLPMTADPGFEPADRAISRRRLQLPTDARLIGHCGSFTQTRGSQILLDAFARVRASAPAARLVLTGRYPRELDRQEGVIGLGMVADDLMPAVLNSLDVACVLLADTSFGRYSYPAKLYEAMACRVPVVASATAPARWILGDAAGPLAQVGDGADLAEKVTRLLAAPTADYPRTLAWPDLAARLEAWLSR